MKKYIILSTLIILIIISVMFVYPKKNKETIKKYSDNSEIISKEEIIKEEEQNENITELNANENMDNKNDDISIHNTNKTNMEVNSASNSNVIKESKTKEKETSSQTVSKSEPESKQEVKETNNEDNTSVNKEEPKKQTPWEALGVSEYHYYNEPMYSWERVDFPVSKYGSEANCRKACAEYGDNYEPYKNGEVLYSCSIVTSLSGKYLGEYFSTEKLN